MSDELQRVRRESLRLGLKESSAAFVVDLLRPTVEACERRSRSKHDEEQQRREGLPWAVMY